MRTGALGSPFPTAWVYEAGLSSQPLVLLKLHEFLSNANGLIPSHICRNLAHESELFWGVAFFLFNFTILLILQVHKSNLIPCSAPHLLSGCGSKQTRPLNEN